LRARRVEGTHGISLAYTSRPVIDPSGRSNGKAIPRKPGPKPEKSCLRSLIPESGDGLAGAARAANNAMILLFLFTVQMQMKTVLQGIALTALRIATRTIARF
jgi:hypothetical protein